MLFVAILEALCGLAQHAGSLALWDALVLAHTVQQGAVGQVLHSSASSAGLHVLHMRMSC